ncbi:MAG: efflux RND transporter periplasmic adaptor subunit [Sedimentisphaerales bacterium]|nr:efflux RND transporter periplasmic adaptor subunit [Sedimentisphaerales bacterium]
MKKVIIILVIVLVLAAATAYRVIRISQQTKATSIVELQAEAGMPVLVHEVTAEDLQHTVAVSGGLEALEGVSISPEVMGRVAEIHVNTGDRVTAGQLLVSLDATRSELRVAQGEAALAQAEINVEKMENGSRAEEIAVAQAQVQRAEAYRDLMEVEYNRQQSLYAEEATTLQQVQRAESEFRVAEADVASAQANYDLVLAGPRDEDVAMARAQRDLAERDLDSLRENLADHYLYSPCAGVVTRKILEVGDIAEVNSPIFSVLAIDEVYLVIDLSELYIPLVRVGMTVDVTVDALHDEVFTGTVAEINPLANTRGRSFVTRILIENADHRLLPGMFARAHIVTREARGALVVPTDSLRQDSAGSFVLVVDDESIARRRDVTVGESFGDRVEIIDGLSVGDMVVTMGSSDVEAGGKVHVSDRVNGREY